MTQAGTTHSETGGPQRHPSFPAPNNLDTSIWRYLPFERFVWLVEKKRLYMSRVEQLKEIDPQEGVIPDGELAWWDEVIAKATTPEKREIAEFNRRRVREFSESFSTGWFVSCWHESPHENFAFWRIYGHLREHCNTCGSQKVSHNNGVAIRSTFKKLELSLPVYVPVGKVRYIDFQEARSTSNMFDYIMQKRKYYSYENEIRAVASAHMLNFQDQNRNDFVAGSYAPQIKPTELIDEIVSNPQSSPDFLTFLTDFCSKNSLPKPRISGI